MSEIKLDLTLKKKKKKNQIFCFFYAFIYAFIYKFTILLCKNGAST